MGGSGCLRLPTNSHLGQSGGEVAGHPRHENHLDFPGVAEHALVLGSGNHVQSNPTEPAFPAQPSNTTIQSDPSQKSVGFCRPTIGLKGFLTSRSTQAWQKIVSFYSEFSVVPSNLPADQAVGIQQLSIG